MCWLMKKITIFVFLWISSVALIQAWSLPWGSTHRDFEIAMKYHEETKYTYAELMAKREKLDWTRQPSVFKEYPRAELIKLSSDTDFNSISVEDAIKKGSYTGSFSGGAITKSELSQLLHHTNGITSVLRYPRFTYYFRAAPSAGALYPTVIYIVVNNVEGLKKGIYHYSVKDHGLHFLKEGDFSKEFATLVNNPSLIKDSSVVFIMSAIFYRTKWKYRERGYRYTLLDTGHVAGNLTLIARALGLGSYSTATFLDDKINQMLDIDGKKEAVLYINAVGRKASSGQKIDLKMPVFKRARPKKLSSDLTVSEALHESGKLYGFEKEGERGYKNREVSYKNYPEAKKFYLPKEFPKLGLDLDDAIRKRRSARDYSDKPISKLELSRLLYYTAAPSIESIYPIELYIVVNNVEGIDKGIYHYNPSEHAIELLKQGEHSLQIADACLGQQLVGNANVAIIKTALFKRIKPYGNRGYRYIHLDAGMIGENIYLEAISMGFGVCGIGAFFDDQINEMLGIDGVDESVIYVTSVGRL